MAAALAEKPNIDPKRPQGWRGAAQGVGEPLR
jgi:hypothetical protein